MRALVQTPPSRVYLSVTHAGPRAGERDRGLRAPRLFVQLLREKASAHTCFEKKQVHKQARTRKRVRALTRAAGKW